ncbi:TetR/AcrR family transcriptional regulator [Hasllibacter sp. MH4015]|uniref:TetR/AcrR family transcriptional regulator n=1 Tax=Hasllibacter sp. MH4015 TaxID=2854029 RepID=UPI001CD61A14|nr:TetR/AcrR family transcriptional regulator [Hasllibacter sp. MH4015]
MTDKEEMIAAAAIRVFSRYGLKRATMNDVADEAGVVRQTLYNVFSNKNEVIEGAIRYYCAGILQRTLADWDGAQTLSEKLDILFQHAVIDPWDALRDAPDAAELEQAAHPAASAAMEEAQANIHAALTDLLRPHGPALAAKGQSPESLAAYLVTATHGIKHNTPDRDRLLGLLATLKTSVEVMVDG